MARGRDIPALTGVRGVAALGVVAFHCWFLDWEPHYWAVDWKPHTFLGWACARGYLFVDLFFLLSGFVMASAYGGLFAGRFGASDYLRFIAVRLARIYPVYAAVLAAYVVVALAHPSGFPTISGRRLALDFTLTQTWFGLHSIVGPAWSLSAEWAVYLVFPLFVTALLNSPAKLASTLWVAALASVAAVWAHNVAGGQLPQHGLGKAERFLTPDVRCAAGFALGVGLFRLKDSARVAFARSDAVGGALLLLTAALWFVPTSPDIAVYACLPPLLLCLALNRGLLARMFGNRAMVALGEWSYSIYLVHWLVLRGRPRLLDFLAGRLPETLADAVNAAILFSVIILVSFALYTLIEVPARRRLRSYIAARRFAAGLKPV